MLSKWWRHALIASIDRSVKVNRLPNYRYVMELRIMLLIGDNCLKMLSDTRRLNKQQNQGKRSKCWDASRQKNLASGDSALTKTMRPSLFFFVPGRRIRRPRDPCCYIYILSSCNWHFLVKPNKVTLISWFIWWFVLSSKELESVMKNHGCWCCKWSDCGPLKTKWWHICGKY